MPKFTSKGLRAVILTAVALMLCKNAVKADASNAIIATIMGLCIVKLGIWRFNLPPNPGPPWGSVHEAIHSAFNFTLIVLACKYLKTLTAVQNSTERMAAILRLPNLLSGWYAYLVPALFAAISARETDRRSDPYYAIPLVSAGSFCVFSSKRDVPI